MPKSTVNMIVSYELIFTKLQLTAVFYTQFAVQL